MYNFAETVSKFAHDVRNPLAGIKGQADLLELRLGDKPDLLRKVNQINSAADAIENLINNFQSQSIHAPRIEGFNLMEFLKELQVKRYFELISNFDEENEWIISYSKSLLLQLIINLLETNSKLIKINLVNEPKNVMMQIINEENEIVFFMKFNRGNL